MVCVRSQQKQSRIKGAMVGLREWRRRYASGLLGSGVNNPIVGCCLVVFAPFWPQKTSELTSWTSQFGQIAGRSGPTRCSPSLFLPPISYLKISPMAQPMVFDVGSTPFTPFTCIISPLFYEYFFACPTADPNLMVESGHSSAAAIYDMV